MYIVDIDDEEPCPYNPKKCDWVTVHINLDKCKTCGEEITY